MEWLAEEVTESVSSNLPPWKVVIVDDDDEVHKVTKMTLNRFKFEERELEFTSLYCGEDAKRFFEKNKDIAILFLDVVMESDQAGLEVVKYIRETLNNHYTRIILRTGQAGSAPENEVIRDYDIDGYKAKTQLTVDRLNHSVYIALRSYRDLIRIQKYQKGLEAIIDSITNLTQIDDVMELSCAVLNQVKDVLNAQNTHFIIKDSQAYSLIKSDNRNWNIAIDKNTASFINDEQLKSEHSPLVELANKAFSNRSSVIHPPYFCYYYRSKRGSETVFILRCCEKLNPIAHKLIRLFSINVILTLENLLISHAEN